MAMSSLGSLGQKAGRWLVGGWLAVSLIPASLEAQTATSWAFPADRQSWQSWGGGDANSVTWTNAQGKTAAGCLRLLDDKTAANPYAISPSLTADNLHSYAFSGWYKPDSGESSQPGLFHFYYNSSGTILKNIGDTTLNVQTSFYAPDANGWKRFVMRVPKSLLAGASDIVSMQCCIRPLSNTQAYLAQGSGWTDDLRFEQWLEETINLKPVMTTKHSDDDTANNHVGGWIDQGNNDLRNLNVSLTEQFNIPVELVNPASNGNKSVVALCGTLSESWYTNQVSVSLSGKPYDRIYLFHTAINAAANGTIGYVDVTYSDSTVQTLPIRLGYELADWYGASVQGKTQSWLLSTSANPSHTPVYLYVTSLELTRPVSTTITSLTFRAETSSTTPWMLFAATGATGTASWLDVTEETASAMPNVNSWVPFVPGIHATASNALSLEFLLDPPAGKHGIVQVVDGHLQFENGTPVRFWGTNIHSNHGLFPTHTQADQIAATLARYGINLVRLHLPESTLIDYTLSTRQTFISDDTKWDKLEYFLHALKLKGIYILLDSITGLSSRNLQAADGVYRASDYNAHRSWAYYDSTLRALGVSYLQTLLSHPNRYESNTPIGQDPALAAVLVINEQSLFWDGTPIVDSYYSNQLKTRFNAWLLTKYTNRAGLESAWALSGGGSALGISEDPAAGTVEMETYASNSTTSVMARAVDASATETQRIRTRDNVRFLQELQAQYYADMTTYARNLGVDCPVIGTNIITDLGEIKSHLATGITTQNHYWNHMAATATTYTVANIPEVSVNPMNVTNSALAESCFTGTKTSGAALAVTETSTMWPNEWRASHMLGVATVGALQGHDLLLHYNYGGGFGKDWDQMTAATHIMYPTLEHNDPAAISSIMAGAFLFLRGDVQTAPNLVQLQVDQTLELAMQNAVWYSTMYPANYLAYVTRFENYFLSQNGGVEPPDYDPGTSDGMTSSGTYVLTARGNATATDSKTRGVALDSALKTAGVVSSSYGLQGNKLISATGEIVRDWGNQLMTINTPKSQGFTGFPTSSAISFNDMTVTSRSPYATMQVSSLDNLELDDSRKMVLIAVSRAENKTIGRRYISGTQPMPMGGQRGEGLVVDIGTYQGPVLLEPVKMTLQINGLAGTTGGYLKLTACNPDMTPSNHVAVFPVNGSNQSNVILENTIVSPWYVLERKADRSTAWDYLSDRQNWIAWGGGDSNSVTWDSSKGHSANGSLKLYDNKTTANPYAISPVQTADANHAYRFTGWYWNTDATEPGLIGFFYNSTGSLVKNIGNTYSGVQYEVSAADANGWKKFTMYIPQSVLAGASIVSAQFCVRPVPNSTPNTDFGKEMWVDDLKIEQLEGRAMAWDFASNMTGWSPWGGHDSNSVTWDSTKGHFAGGSVKLHDNKTTANPYMCHWPAITSDAHHGYRLSGWYWNTTGTQPGLLAFFLNASGSLVKNISNTSTGVQYEVSAADANGWKRFTYYVPKSLLVGSSIVSMQWGIRPQPNTNPLTDQGEQMWIDDVTLEMMPE